MAPTRSPRPPRSRAGPPPAARTIRAEVALPAVDALPARVARAAEARTGFLGPDTTVYRLIHDQADDLPQVQVDRAGSTAIIQAYHPQWGPLLGALAEAVCRHGGVGSARAVVREQGGTSAGQEVWHGQAPEESSAWENGLAFRVRPRDASLNMGLFPDARGARSRVRLLARGQSVLNLFAYAGGFTVAALAGGAIGVDHVDTNPKMASWGARNVAINGLRTRACRFVVDDAAHFSQRAVRQNRRYGLVVVDPPTFGRSPRGVHTNHALSDLAQVVFRAATPSGRVLWCNNTATLTAADLWCILAEAAADAGTALTWEDTLEAGADFPRAGPGMSPQRFKALQLRIR